MSRDDPAGIDGPPTDDHLPVDDGPPADDGTLHRVALVGAFVVLVGAVAATLFYLPIGFALKESVVVGVFTSIAVFSQTVLDDATFGTGD